MQPMKSLKQLSTADRDCTQRQSKFLAAVPRSFFLLLSTSYSLRDPVPVLQRRYPLSAQISAPVSGDSDRPRVYHSLGI